MNNKTIIRHGELLLKEVDLIPNGAKLIKKCDEYIAAFSETHHHHIVRTLDRTKKDNIVVYEVDGKHYLQIGTEAELYHKKTGADVHTPHTLKPANYKIIIKKSFNYFSKAMERVND